MSIKINQNIKQKESQAKDKHPEDQNSDLLWAKSIKATVEVENKNNKEKVIAPSIKIGVSENAPKSLEKSEELLEGLNFDKLKKKYKKNMESDFNKNEIDRFEEENEGELYKELEKNNIITTDIVNLIFLFYINFLKRIKKSFRKKKKNYMKTTFPKSQKISKVGVIGQVLELLSLKLIKKLN